MLFNSYVFILLFLPITALGYFILGKRGHISMALCWLVLASLFFYGWWNPPYLLLIIASICVNYGLGRILSNQQKFSPLTLKAFLIIGIAINLGLLGYFKYANFFIDTLNLFADTDIGLHKIFLPLAISFFTFQQIAFLVDAYRGEVREYNFLHYCLFVTFFPQLIAGPIVHHKEMLPQFNQDNVYSPKENNIAIGLTIFIIGLFKKVVIADNIALFANPTFDSALVGETITFYQAWWGALAYTFQLYFDFSGYSDMAIGLARIFGIVLPLNFNSPYKSVNIIEFWRRWHMTLSRFLRDYVYIGLGGNRKGPSRRHINLFITMLIGGLWHGAGWTFVLWGGLHGLYLVLNHAWHWFKRAVLHQNAVYSTVIGRTMATLVTFVAVVVSWVFFRAESFDAALAIIEGMMGVNGFGLNPEYIVVLTSIINPSYLQLFFWQPSAVWVISLSLLLLSLIIFFAPNSQEIMKIMPQTAREPSKWRIQHLFHWKPGLLWSGGMAMAFVLCVPRLNSLSEFLYFQF